MADFFVRANGILCYSETNIHAGLQIVYEDNVLQYGAVAKWVR
jgi:hypothetical protein